MKKVSVLQDHAYISIPGAVLVRECALSGFVGCVLVTASALGVHSIIH